MDARTKPIYDPAIFLQPNADAAKRIILMPEQNLSPEERWERETAWLLPKLRFPPGSLVVDYGCGIGRMAKVLEKNAVLGVDISATMRAQAENYVQRTDFAAVTPPMLWQLVKHGLKAKGALAVWVLQHVAAPEIDLSLLHAALLEGALLHVVNRCHRCIPTGHGWADDGFDLDAALDERFELKHSEAMPEHLCAPGAWFRIYARR